jgi:hypothetical protein
MTRSKSLRLASRLVQARLAGVTEGADSPLAVLEDELPWSRDLSLPERRRCLRDLMRIAASILTDSHSVDDLAAMAGIYRDRARLHRQTRERREAGTPGRQPNGRVLLLPHRPNRPGVGLH